MGCSQAHERSRPGRGDGHDVGVQFLVAAKAMVVVAAAHGRLYHVVHGQW